ncbi:MAG: hypothetical protein V4597_08625 [Pseudomonadota bacterium]
MRVQPPLRIFVGWDPAQLRACAVAMHSARARASAALDLRRLGLPELVARGLYARPTRHPEPGRPGYYDEISAAPMSTGHAIARFLVPTLCGHEGWALFTDGDVLFRRDPADLFAVADPGCAVQVVKHLPIDGQGLKMTGAVQTSYARKNWSSVMLFNCGHPANAALDAGLVNTVPGRDLHRFCWLDDSLVGGLPSGWNHLVGTSFPDPDPALVHFTDGVPDMPGYEHCQWSDEWHAAARTCGYRLGRLSEASR